MEAVLSARKSVGSPAWPTPCPPHLRTSNISAFVTHLVKISRGSNKSRVTRRLSVGSHTLAHINFVEVADATTEFPPELSSKAQAAFNFAQLYSLGLSATRHSAPYAVRPQTSEINEDGNACASSLPLASFLDQALRVSREGQLTTPSTPLRIVTTISRLRFGSAADSVPYQALYQRAATAMMEAADGAGVYSLEYPTFMSAQEILAYFEAVTGMSFPARVYKGSGFGHLLAYHLRHSSFSHQQLLRLLEAWATLRQGKFGYNPCVLNFRKLGQLLTSAAPSMTPEELRRTVIACRAFEWPVYSSLSVLEGICSATVSRVVNGNMPVLSGQRILGAAVQTAACYRPALGTSLRNSLPGTMLSAQAKCVHSTNGAPTRPSLQSKPLQLPSTLLVGRSAGIGPTPTSQMAAASASIAAVGSDGRMVGSLLWKLPDCLPVAVLLAFFCIPMWPPAETISALMVVSLMAASKA